MAYLSNYLLSLADARALRLTDTYSLHRIVYDLFENTRGGNTGESSGILFVDKGMNTSHQRRLLVLSDREPRPPRTGSLECRPIPPSWLTADAYRFELVINPTRRDSASRKLVPVRGRENVAAWFRDKAPGWGFTVAAPLPQVDDITVDRFTKGGQNVTLCKARLTGVLSVTDHGVFTRSVCHGIGRGRAFGCGLLQIIPLV